jgi:hypothetical protein
MTEATAQEAAERVEANTRRLMAIAEELEEMADGYREKADQLLREAASIRIAAARLLSKLELPAVKGAAE